MSVWMDRPTAPTSEVENARADGVEQGLRRARANAHELLVCSGSGKGRAQASEPSSTAETVLLGTGDACNRWWWLAWTKCTQGRRVSDAHPPSPGGWAIATAGMRSWTG